MCLRLLGLRSQTPTGALPLDPAEDFPTPSFVPPYQIPGYAPVNNNDSVLIFIFVCSSDILIV